MLSKGSWVAIVTPMLADLSIDYLSLAKLIEWHIESGTSGIVLLGTTGESPTITDDERNKLIEFTREKTLGKIQLMVGVGHNNPIQAKRWSQEASNFGVDGLLVVTPCYNRPTVKGLINYYIDILEASSVPVVAYNVPSRTGCDLTEETLDAIWQHKRFVGIKEASSSLLRAWSYSLSYPDIQLYSGNDDTFLPFIKLGGHGVISVAANIMPREVADICVLALSGQWQGAIEKDQRLQGLYKAMSLQTNPIPCKKMLLLMDKIGTGIRAPLHELDCSFDQSLKTVGLALGILKHENDQCVTF